MSPSSLPTVSTPSFTDALSLGSGADGQSDGALIRHAQAQGIDLNQIKSRLPEDLCLYLLDFDPRLETFLHLKATSLHRAVARTGPGHAETTRPYSLNLHPVARAQLRRLAREAEPSMRDVRLMADAAVRLTAPEHAGLRHEVLEAVARALRDASGDWKISVIEPLLAAAANSAGGDDIAVLHAHDTQHWPRVTVDDVARVSFALAVANIAREHLADLPDSLQRDLEYLARALPDYAVKAVVCALASPNRSSFLWMSQRREGWTIPYGNEHHIAIEYATRQRGFPAGEVLAALQDASWPDGKPLHSTMAIEKAHRIAMLLDKPDDPGWDWLLSGDIPGLCMFRPQLEHHLDHLAAAYAARPERQAALERLLQAEGVSQTTLNSDERAFVDRFLQAMARAVDEGRIRIHEPALDERLLSLRLNARITNAKPDDEAAPGEI